MARNELRALTGLRGIAAVWVMIFHSENSGSGGGFIMRFLFQHAYLAVDLFFVLSGFVIALNYAEQFQQTLKSRDLARFAVKRYARIYPLYLFTLIVGLIEVGFGLFPSVTNTQVIANALLVQQWGLAPSIDPPAWSISTEFAAYLLFPFLAYCLLSKGAARAAIGAGAAFILVAYAVTKSSGTPAFDSPYPLLRCIGGFTLGACAWKLSSLASKHQLGRLATPLALLLLAAATLPHGDLLFIALAPLAVCALSSERGEAAGLLASPFLYRIGEISYSIYLLHWLSFPFVRMVPGPHLPVALAMSVLIILAAELTYRFIEVPGRRWISAVFVSLPGKIGLRPNPLKAQP